MWGHHINVTDVVTDVITSMPQMSSHWCHRCYRIHVTHVIKWMSKMSSHWCHRCHNMDVTDVITWMSQMSLHGYHRCHYIDVTDFITFNLIDLSYYESGLTLSLPAYHCRQWKCWRIYASAVAKGLNNNNFDKSSMNGYKVKKCTKNYPNVNKTIVWNYIHII